jgi:molybdate transport system ATP-binding protein
MRLAHVALRLDDRLVFRNTCWTFGRNQHWALVGPNGAGKTLLASSIAGELPFVEGEILYGFRAPSGRLCEDCIVLVSFEKQKALAGDAPHAVRWFSLEQEQALPVERFLSQNNIEEINPFEVKNRSPESEANFERLRRNVLSLLNISELVNRPFLSLSNGEMRKILLARALLKRPRLLILDDVFAGLDVHFRSHLKDVLEKIMARGVVRLLLIDCVWSRRVQGKIWNDIQGCAICSVGEKLQSFRAHFAVCTEPSEAKNARRSYEWKTCPFVTRRRKSFPELIGLSIGEKAGL